MPPAIPASPAGRPQPIDPDDPQGGQSCPQGTVGKWPWCWYPTARQFTLLAHTDREGKPSSARVVSSWCLALASLLISAHVLTGLFELPPVEHVDGLVYALIAAATGTNAAGRLGRAS